MIDAGHGGRDPGAIGVGGLREKDVTLRLAKTLGEKLAARGFAIVYTRKDDRSIGLEERTAIAESVGGDLFVSLHANAAPRRSVAGIETYYLDANHERHSLGVAARENGVLPSQVDALQRTVAKLRVSEVSVHSRRVANAVHQQMVAGLAGRYGEVNDLGVKKGPFYVLFLSNMPAILVEAGFLTNRGEARRLRDVDYLDDLAQQITIGLDALPRRERDRGAGEDAVNRGPSIDAVLARVQDASGGQVVPVVRQYLGDVRAFLRELQVSGAGGAVVNETHSDLIDRLVRRLFEFAEEAYFARGAEADTDLCVVAVGGYARREMSIHSDVDLLFLYRDSLTPYVASVAERVQQWLWDAALTVGGATRTIADTVSLAREDATVQTAVLAPRFLVGSGVLFHELTEALRVQVFADPARFIENQLAGMAERHMRFGDSLYLLQPNLKDGAGGLRDYQVSYWAMQATQPSARGRDDFLQLGLLKEEELAEYEAALDFLWRVRNQLHLLSGRKNDQMSFELQEQIAESLGWAAGDDADAELPVERFMSEYYRHARVVQSCSSLVIEQCQARLRGKPRQRKVQEVEEGFRVADGQLEIPHPRMLRERPRAAAGRVRGRAAARRDAHAQGAAAGAREPRPDRRRLSARAPRPPRSSSASSAPSGA